MMQQALSTWVPVIRGLMLLALLHNYQKWISDGFRNAGKPASAFYWLLICLCLELDGFL